MTERKPDLAAADRFAAIALQPAATDRPKLSHIPPLKLPVRALESGRSDGRGAPAPAARMETAADLEARLADLRAHYAPFLRDLTPPPAQARPRQELRAFAFRLEEPEDRREAARPWGESGAWEQVTIPHYRGPVGRWAGYYRTTFVADTALSRPGRTYLVFRGVDYRCQVYLNGLYLGGHEGFFAPFELDVTEALRAGENTLLVRAENDFPTVGAASWSAQDYDADKIYAATGLGWDEPGRGWCHCPPGAGICQPVYLEGRPALFISDLWVRPDLDHEEAEAWVEVTNAEVSHAPLTLTLQVIPRNFAGPASEPLPMPVPTAGPGPNLFRLRLSLRGARVWSPDEPYLYTLRARIAADVAHEGPGYGGGAGARTDERDVSFGMRKYHMDTLGEPKGTLYLNNQPVFLRGSNTMGHEQRCVFNGDRERLIEDMLLFKAAHFNFLRITQRPVQDEVYDVLDALGLLQQCDLPLFGYLRYNQFAEAVRQAGEMERLIRRHPCAIQVSFINEPFGNAPGTEKHARMLDRPALEGFFAAATAAVHANNPDRVVKPVDGDYDPPAPGLPDEHCYCLWYNNHGEPFGKLQAGWLLPLKPGWRGGCGEYGIEALDSWETMRARYPKAWIPTRPDEPWDPGEIYGSQTLAMHGKFYDPEETLDGWVRASQRHQAWGLRQMTAAFRRRADIMVSTVVHLGIDAWPAGWLKSVVSVDRTPKPAYFAMADILTPLAANLRTARRAVYGGERIKVEAWVLNDRPVAPEGAQLVWWVEVGGQLAFSQRTAAGVRPSGAVYQGEIAWQTPEVSERTRFVVGLALVDAQGRTLHDDRLEMEAFPRPDLARFRGRTAAILGQEGGRAWQLAEMCGLTPAPFGAAASPALAIADHPAAAEAVGGALTAWLEAGGRLLCLEQPEGEGAWRIAGRRVSWRAFDPAFFASRKTGHAAVAGLQADDLAWWHDAAAGRIEPTFRAILEGEGLEQVAFTVSTIPAGIRKTRAAHHAVAGEIAVGKGRAMFSQIDALRRTPAEPQAMGYLVGILGYLMG